MPAWPGSLRILGSARFWHQWLIVHLHSHSPTSVCSHLYWTFQCETSIVCWSMLILFFAILNTKYITIMIIKCIHCCLWAHIRAFIMKHDNVWCFPFAHFSNGFSPSRSDIGPIWSVFVRWACDTDSNRSDSVWVGPMESDPVWFSPNWYDGVRFVPMRVRIGVLSWSPFSNTDNLARAEPGQLGSVTEGASSKC